jgi:hypothetical protein
MPPILKAATSPPFTGGSTGSTRTTATALTTFGPSDLVAPVATCGAGAGALLAIASGETAAVSNGTGFAAAAGGGFEVADRSDALNSPLRLRASTKSCNRASGEAFRMLSASAGESTPLVASTPTNAARFVLPRAGVGFMDGCGLTGATGDPAGFGAAAALATGLLFASAASFVPANSGAIDTAAISEPQIHPFRFICYVVLRNREPFVEVSKRDNISPNGPSCILS